MGVQIFCYSPWGWFLAVNTEQLGAILQKTTNTKQIVLLLPLELFSIVQKCRIVGVQARHAE